ncbi:MAG TPA: zf-HC2 domain-containing protein [Candidatus Polarisedimenticolia bacterium]|jgi:anti-sigma factor RsiW|nr:zf-HC2 domain-containing protein [Candidatus Polarisedimenticolia bacterium]
MPSRRNPPTCRDVLALLTEYMEGGLPPVLAGELTRHLEGCVACGRFLESIRTTRAAVNRLRCDQVPEEVHARLRAFLRAAGGEA